VIKEYSETNIRWQRFTETSILFCDIWLQEAMKAVKGFSRHSKAVLKVVIMKELRIEKTASAPVQTSWVDIPLSITGG